MSAQDAIPTSLHATGTYLVNVHGDRRMCGIRSGRYKITVQDCGTAHFCRPGGRRNVTSQPAYIISRMVRSPTDGCANYIEILSGTLTPTLTQYEAADLPGLGPISFTDIGEENMYFTLKNGSLGFVKTSW